MIKEPSYKQHVLVTGATGFVGTALVRHLSATGRFSIVAALRRQKVVLPTEAVPLQITDLTADNDWTAALDGVDTVVHLAARLHIKRNCTGDSLSEFRRVNVYSTLNLARQAASIGAKRFIFLSSIKVNGEATQPGRPFTEHDYPSPQDFYSISKYEAEVGLIQVAEETGLEMIIIRPPLVYGPGAKANFQSIMRLVNRRIPLPLGAIDNQRSLLALDNLMEFILICIEHPAAANQTFLVADGEDLTTTGLLQRVGKALGKKALLIPVPPTLVKLGAKLFGRADVAQRLCGSLQVDISKARDLLGWTPSVSVDEGLRRAAKACNC